MANLTDLALNVNRVQTHWYEATANGLLPNTIHTITLDGVAWDDTSRQRGKDFGAPMISDANGCLFFGFLVEVPFARNQNFELPRTTTLQFQNEQNASQNRQATQTVLNYRVVDLTNVNGTSQAQLIIPKRILLSQGPVRTQFPIE